MSDKHGDYYIGVDVGTGSARACVVDHQGNIVGLASQDIKTWRPHPEYYEQSTSNIWNSICVAVKEAVQQCGTPVSNIRGLAFDATCSLAVFSRESDSPVSISSPDFTTDRNVILWLDHRAVDETKIINATNHPVLDYVGGAMSVEMEMPKILWLKNHMRPDQFRDCKFYDLADALTHLATDKETRSYCSAICKQGYLASATDGRAEGWQLDFLTAVGLENLAADDFGQLGGINGQNGEYLSAGQCVGLLSEKAAASLGLLPGVAVGSGVIDAYAGWIGTVGAKVGLGIDSGDEREQVVHRLAVVAGTSTCHLAMSNEELFVPGVWGPYQNVLFPGAYLAEGGQSATGELIRHVVESHPAYPVACKAAKTGGIHIYDFLNKHLQQEALRKTAPSVSHLAKHFFFYGDLWGNRSPIADPDMTGTIIGLKSDLSINNLALHYYGALEFIALQTRQIVDTMNEHGHQISVLFMSGSQIQNGILVNLIASTCKVPVVLPEYVHAAVCHGAAMLAAMAASSQFASVSKDLWTVMGEMSKPGWRVDPSTDENEQRLLQAKYEVFLDMCFRQREYRDLVDRKLSAGQ
ncbi:putative FGGY-family carbohydrate kinase [Aspergillus sclerotioniger CBS 115572]|uniref:Putative FGGY-family carbohydrate kinase n=1 Tax=Aspergillus sclerotioniger CBS 115572 TaxID=1450535 RepID=A0A317UY07_9EURO|nr:putative FGGY-family carbohydrate kinase [Aspergillus sclerotioniger CBS 115572]PWY66476.1 putative FGGY-family carbohydrate kinase [Aspergillus sclerotioniger CBS 115572]